MTDRREEIMVALFDVLKTCVPNPEHVWRNRLSLPEKLRPAIIMFDGDESLAEDVESYGRHRPPGAQAIMMDAAPEIYFFVEAQDGTAAGEALSEIRNEIIKQIYASQTLVALCANGDIRYLGYATGFAEGRKAEGEAGVQFSFRYVLKPSQL